MRRPVVRAGVGAALVALALVWSADGVEACSCIDVGPACQHAWEVDAVFVGRVVRISDGEPDPRYPSYRNRRVSVEVIEAFRGIDAPASTSVPASVPAPITVDVFTGRGGGDCGFLFSEGKSYLIYAHAGRGDRRELQASICSRTRELSQADEDLAYLRSIAARGDASGAASRDRGAGAGARADPSNAPNTSTVSNGRIFGRVELLDDVPGRLPGASYPNPKPMSGIPVVLTSDAGVWRASTNDKGEYEFNGLAPAMYRVRPELPDKYYSQIFPPEAVLRDVRACREMSIRVKHDGRVSGRVVDASGAPLAGLTVVLIAPGVLDTRHGFAPTLMAITNDDGAYEVTRVPPGMYLAVYNAARAWMSTPGKLGDLLYPRVLFPGVTRPSAARIIEVGAGERVKIADWRMPETLTFTSVIGIVTTPGGQPAEGAEVSLLSDDDKAPPIGTPAITDASGRFRLAAIVGHRYRLSALLRPQPAGDAPSRETPLPPHQARYGPFVAEKDAPPVTLRLLRTGGGSGGGPPGVAERGRASHEPGRTGPSAVAPARASEVLIAGAAR